MNLINDTYYDLILKDGTIVRRNFYIDDFFEFAHFDVKINEVVYAVLFNSHKDDNDLRLEYKKYLKTFRIKKLKRILK